MPNSKKTYTNNDIYKRLDDMDGRINVLENREQARDIAKQAVDEYKKDEESRREANQKREVYKQIGVVLTLIAALIYVYLEAHGHAIG